METIASKMPNITALDVESVNISINGLNSLLKLTQLSSLNISRSSVFYEDDFLQRLSKLKSLKTLIFDGGNKPIEELKHMSHLIELHARGYMVTDFLKFMGQNLKGLRCFKFTGNSDLTDESYSHLMGMQHLKELNISDTKVTPQIFKAVGKQLKQLTRIDLGCSSIDDQGLQEVSKCEKLRHLNLFRCHHITDLGLKQLKTLLHLRYLNVDHCKLITDEGFSFLIKYLKNISELNVSGLPLTDQTVIVMSSSMKNLIKLNISSCRQVTPLGFKAIGNLIKLKELIIDRVSIDDDCFQLFSSNLTKLRKLDISWNNNITENSIDAITKLSKLNFIDVTMTDITDAGITVLTQNLRFLKVKP